MIEPHFIPTHTCEYPMEIYQSVRYSVSRGFNAMFVMYCRFRERPTRLISYLEVVANQRPMRWWSSEVF